VNTDEESFEFDTILGIHENIYVLMWEQGKGNMFKHLGKLEWKTRGLKHVYFGQLRNESIHVIKEVLT